MRREQRLVFADRRIVEEILSKSKAAHYGLRTLVLQVVQSELFLNK